MSCSHLISSQEANNCYWAQNYDQAFRKYIDLFDANPRAWWFALEAIRCKRSFLSCSPKGKKIFYSPDYTNNSYQSNLYSEAENFKYSVLAKNTLVIDDELVASTFSESLVYHQHWLKELYWQSGSRETGVNVIDRHISILRVLKAYGAKVCWTLHNLVDHDATPLQEDLNNYAVQQMAGLSDHIFIHSREAGKLLAEHCTMDLSAKLELLEHPLYDNLLRSAEPELPIEINPRKLEGRRILVSLGMIRPYKGVVDLIDAFRKFAVTTRDHRLQLIVGGQLQDPGVEEILNRLDSETRDCITLIARRLDENEIVRLMQMAHLSVTPYRKILTSGSYYLSTTFGKPTVAPSKGIFPEIIEDEKNGFLYDGTSAGLVGVLHKIARLSDKELELVGGHALRTCRHLDAASVSSRFFSALENIK